MRSALIALSLGCLLPLTRVAHAQEFQQQEKPKSHGFIEGNGAWGTQYGVTDYLPDNAINNFKFPFVFGWNFGGTIGVRLDGDLFLIANYEFTTAKSNKGAIPQVLDKVQGDIKYHTASIGFRFMHKAGIGQLRADITAGLLFPFHVQENVTYGPALSQLPTPITGTGFRRRNFGLGLGVAMSFGYQIPLGSHLYIAPCVRVKAFESDNDGATTQYSNFVTDFNTDNPQAVTAVVKHGDGFALPETYSVQDIRVQLAVGVNL